MKRRLGFVSNSSTSSFICGICDEVEAGRDLELESVEMFQCVNEHALHEECASKAGTVFSDLEDKDGDLRWEVPEENCPICQLKALSTDDLLGYLRLEKDVAVGDAIAGIIGKYGDYKTFKAAVRKLGEFETVKGGK